MADDDPISPSIMDELHPRKTEIEQVAAGPAPRLSSAETGLCADKAAQVIREVALANTPSLVTRSCIEEVIHTERARLIGCITMPFYYLFFALYVAAATLHEDIPNVHLIESSLRSALVPPLAGLLTKEDIWGYINTLVVPTFFKQKDMYDNPITDASLWSRVYTYNQLLGGLAFEQVRSIAEPCENELAAHMMCYPQKEYSAVPFGRNLSSLAGVNLSILSDANEGFAIEASRRLISEDSESQNVMARRLRVLRNELERYMPVKSSDDSHVFKFFLYPSSRVSELKQRTDYMRQRGWIDDSTARVTIKALVLNPEIEPPRVENVRWYFALSRGGGVFATMRFETLFLRGWNSDTSVFIDVLFVLMLVAQTLYCFCVAISDCRRGKCKGHFKSLVNILGILIVSICWVNLAGFIMQQGYRQKVTDQIELSQKASVSNTTTLKHFQERSTELHKAADDMTSFAGYYRLLITYLNLFFMVRCFLILEFQPRLAVVVATLKATSVDLAHFLIVFVPTFVAYAVAGMCIFGRRVEEFSSFDRSLGTCFKIAMESEYDWDKMSEEDFFTAASWVWTFLLLIVLLMLNMVLAIIMDVYTEVRNHMGSAETVFDNVQFLYQRLALSRTWISDEKLLDKLAEMPLVLTGKEFQKAFPQMTYVQYRRLMGLAINQAQTTTRTGVHNSYLAHMTSAIKVGLDRAARSLDSIMADEANTREIQGEKRPNNICVEDIMQSMAVQNHWMTSVQTQLESLRGQIAASEGSENLQDGGSARSQGGGSDS